MSRAWIVILVLGLAYQAHAALGDVLPNSSTASTPTTSAQANGQVRVSMARTPLFRSQKLASPIRTVRQFANSSGRVFAFTWRGLNSPNLKKYMGPYYSEFQQAEMHNRRPMGRAPYVLKTKHLVIVMGGHMRDVVGKVYVRDLKPSNVGLQDLKASR